MEKTSKKKIVLTGGGTAGHVSPNIALLPYLQEAGYEITYMGSKNGIEKNLIADFGLPYVGISTGKLRRYFDVKNFTDPFRVVNGFREARKFLKKYKPDVVFSKGGFVSVPVVRAAGSLHIPCVIHESDMTPGLANKLCFGSAKKICSAVTSRRRLGRCPPTRRSSQARRSAASCSPATGRRGLRSAAFRPSGPF